METSIKIVMAMAAATSGGEEAPTTPERPTAKVIKAVKEHCPCGGACECGCQEGGECRCNDQARLRRIIQDTDRIQQSRVSYYDPSPVPSYFRPVQAPTTQTRREVVQPVQRPFVSSQPQSRWNESQSQYQPQRYVTAPASIPIPALTRGVATRSATALRQAPARDWITDVRSVAPRSTSFQVVAAPRLDVGCSAGG